QDAAEEQHELGQQVEDEQRRHEPEDPGERVVGPAEGAGEIEREDAVALVASEQLRRLRGAEEADDRGTRQDREHRVVADRRVRADDLADLPAEAGDENERGDDRDRREDREDQEEPRGQLRPGGPSQAVGRAEAVGEQRPDRETATQPGSGVAAITQVVDRAGRAVDGQGCGHGGGPGAASGSGGGGGGASTATAAAPSSGASRNRSSRRCRRCSIRMSGRPRSATVSRTRSYARSPSSAMRTARPSTIVESPAAARPAASASLPSSTSTASVPVCSVKSPSGAARRSLPPSIATRKLQTRSISPRRCDATMTAIPNSRPVRRISSSISSRPAGSRTVVRPAGSSRPAHGDHAPGCLD